MELERHLSFGKCRLGYGFQSLDKPIQLYYWKFDHVLLRALLAALNSTNLLDDDNHHHTEALTAAVLADLSGSSVAIVNGMLLGANPDNLLREAVFSCRYNLAVLLRA